MANHKEIRIDTELFNKITDVLVRAIKWDYRDSDFPNDDEIKEVLIDLYNTNSNSTIPEYLK